MHAECGDTDLFDVSSSGAPSTVQPLCRDGQANDPARGFPDVTSGASCERGPSELPSRASTGTERPMVVTCGCSGPQALIACWSDTPWDDTQCAGRARHWDQLGSLPGSVMTGSSG